MTRFSAFAYIGQSIHSLAVATCLALLAGFVAATPIRGAQAAPVEECLMTLWQECYAAVGDTGETGECYLNEAMDCTPPTAKVVRIPPSVGGLTAASDADQAAEYVDIDLYCYEEINPSTNTAEIVCVDYWKAATDCIDKFESCDIFDDESAASVLATFEAETAPGANDPQAASTSGACCTFCDFLTNLPTCAPETCTTYYPEGAEAACPGQGILATCDADKTYCWGRRNPATALPPEDQERLAAISRQSQPVERCCRICPQGGTCEVSSCHILGPDIKSCGLLTAADCTVEGIRTVCRPRGETPSIDAVRARAGSPAGVPAALPIPERPEPLPRPADAVPTMPGTPPTSIPATPVPSSDSTAGGAGHN
jgi:hypothetical protein